MRAISIQHSDRARAVAKRDEIFAEQAHAHGRAVGLGKFGGENRGQPVAAKDIAHRRALADTGQALIVLFGKHVSSFVPPDYSAAFSFAAIGWRDAPSTTPASEAQSAGITAI